MTSSNRRFYYPLPVDRIDQGAQSSRRIPVHDWGTLPEGCTSNMRLAAVLVLCCVLAEGATKNKWKDRKCLKKHAQGLCATTNCPKKAKKCEKTATQRWLRERERPVWRGRDSALLVGSASS